LRMRLRLEWKRTARAIAGIMFWVVPPGCIRLFLPHQD